MIYLRLALLGGAFIAGGFVVHWYHESNMADHYSEALAKQRLEFEQVLSRQADMIQQEAKRSATLSRQVKALRDSNAELREEIDNAEFRTPNDGECRAHPVRSPDFKRLYNKAADAGRAETGDGGPE